MGSKSSMCYYALLENGNLASITNRQLVPCYESIEGLCLLLIAKLYAYAISNYSLQFVYNYLKQRKRKVKAGSSYSDFLEINLGS